MPNRSTIELYHERRKALLRSILEQREEANITAVYCESDRHCGAGTYSKTGYEAAEYHVHHVDPEKGVDVHEGGWQHLLILEKQVAEGVELRVLCRECHERLHSNGGEA